MPVGSIDWIVSETESNGAGLAQYNVQEIYQAQTPTSTGGGMYTSNWASGILSQQLTAMGIWTYGTLNSFIIVALPLFVFMAELMGETGLTDEVYDGVQKWLRRLPGGLGVASVAGCAGFAAASGVSAATAATMGRVAVPAMLDRGYDKKLACGTIAAGGTLGILIPPSVAMILYAHVSEESIGRLFMAGFMPGFMMATMFSLYLIGVAIFRPGMIPPVREMVTWKDRLVSLPNLLPLALLAVVVLGSMYFGIATPTEAAAIGCLQVLAMAAVRRRLNLSRVRAALMSSVETTSFILLIVAAIIVFGYLLVILNIPQELTQWVLGLGLSRWLVLWMMIGIYFILGMFIEPVSIILLTTPVFLPMIKALGFDPIWYGVLLVLNLEVALITPPVGMTVYIIAGQVERYGVTVFDVFRGIVPFVVLLLMGMALLMVFPQIALWLPSTMR